MPFRSWYLPGLLAELTNAAVRDLGFVLSVITIVPPIVPPKNGGTPRNNQDGLGMMWQKNLINTETLENFMEFFGLYCGASPARHFIPLAAFLSPSCVGLQGPGFCFLR